MNEYQEKLKDKTSDKIFQQQASQDIILKWEKTVYKTTDRKHYKNL